jgi:hypothetical protein
MIHINRIAEYAFIPSQTGINLNFTFACIYIYKESGRKCKAIPVQAWINPGGSRSLRLPGFSGNGHMKVVVCPTHRPPLPPKTS